ncbi:MAG TPA: peptidoglycan recognition family protein [Anaerolineae bacterium]|nr:peptidoglycan recognition family protein [Anaerolineae bacterium]
MVFSDESCKLFVGRFLLPEEIEEWVVAQNMGSKPATGACDHHTPGLSLEDWKGLATINAIFSYYERKGWPKGVGPHFFVTDKGIWVATHPRHDGIGTAGYNHRVIHIEIVGDFDEKPTDGDQLINLYRLKHALAENPGIQINQECYRFHRDDALKSCPGAANSKELLIDAAAQWSPAPVVAEQLRRTVTREEFVEALLRKGLPAILKGPRLNLSAPITRHEVTVLVERAYQHEGVPVPNIMRDWRSGDLLMEHELAFVLEKLSIAMETTPSYVSA